MRQREEDELRLLREPFGFRLAEAQRPGQRMIRELRKHLGERLSGVLARSDCGQVRVGMVEQQPDELFAGVTRSADNGDLFHFLFHSSKTTE